MRVIEAILRSAKTGRAEALRAPARTWRPMRRDVLTKTAARHPRLVGVHAPHD